MQGEASRSQDTEAEPTESETTAKAATVGLMEYNGRNQLVKSVEGGISTEYTYRPDGLRYSKTTDGTTTKHIWDGQNIIADTSPVGVSKYVRGINLLSREYQRGAGAGGTTETVVETYLFNAHGDVVQLADTAGNITRDYEYDAFGNPPTGPVNNGEGGETEEPDAGGTGTGTASGAEGSNQGYQDTNPFRYAGEYLDLSSGMYYLRARNYQPTTGRFLTEDTFKGEVKDPLSLNVYTYCYNNPLKYNDPSGNTPMDIFYGFVTALDDNLLFGVAQGISELAFGKFNNTYESEYDYYAGRTAGDIFSIALSVGEITAGLLEIGASIMGGAALTVGSGGTLAVGGVVIVGEGVIAGTAAATHGISAVAMAAGNFGNDFSRMQEAGKTEFKEPSSGSGKEKASDVPSWTRNNPEGKPYKSENGKSFAERMMNQQYGQGNWESNSNRMSEYSKIKKWGDRGFK